jgi:conjugal transfer mating pair stabilization protein TraN
MDGACFDTAYEPSQDFGVAAANLGVISDAAADFDVNANVIFGGEDLRCSKAILGYSNCCKLDGWGQDIGLDQCSSDEQRLALARKAGLCHSIGSYCSASNIFGCTSRKETHCCFKSKLARIIQEQGRTQLGMGWGGPENPQCGGFTMEQLQSLDFSQIDFSEFYADAFDKANGPSGGELQGIIDNYIQQSLP